MSDVTEHPSEGRAAAEATGFRTSPVRVRWSDLDALGHVTAALFVTFIEEGRDEWLEHVLGDEFATDRYVMARIEIDYRSEIPFGTRWVETRHRVETVGSSSVSLLEQLVIPDGPVAADARAVLVMWDPAKRGSRALSEVEAERFARVAAAAR